MEILTVVRFAAIFFAVLTYIIPRSKFLITTALVLLIAAVVSALVAQINILGAVTYSLFAITQYLYLREFNENEELADLCNRPIEDIYYARRKLGWDKDWIRENVPGFYARLIVEKRKEGITEF